MDNFSLKKEKLGRQEVEEPFKPIEDLEKSSRSSLFSDSVSLDIENLPDSSQDTNQDNASSLVFLNNSTAPIGVPSSFLKEQEDNFKLGLLNEHKGSFEHEGHDHDDHACDDLFPGIQSISGSSGGDLPTQGGTFDLSKTFLLNSNSTASHTIYLDFDGYTTTDSAWTQYNGGNAIATASYDIDGNTSAFSTEELTRIQNIWQRVAEDFSPFQVNVTTQDPGLDALINSGSGDTRWGTRVVVGAGDWYGAAGGVAYLSSFTASLDRPAFVFTNYLGNGNEKYTAEAISHEAGHTLGLNHDGQGATAYYSGHGTGGTGWASIMGVGYYKELTQWGKGEYSGATNLQDDLAVITGRNGFSYRADDHGNTFGTATVLTPSVTALSAAGIIERNTDYDIFSFRTGTGQVSLQLGTAPRGANLDILANLYNGSGQLVATSNPVDYLSAGFDMALDAGQYFVEVMGTGKGDPLNGGYSNYGSLGQYTLTGTIVSANEDYLQISPLTANLSEGDSGGQIYTFVVDRTGVTTEGTSVDYAVSGFGTNAASADDFENGVFSSGTLQFAANETSKVIEVIVTGDTAIETDEGFRVTLSNPGTHTTLMNQSAEGIIRNDDTPAVANLVINDVTVSEGAGVATLTVSRSGNLNTAVSVGFKTTNGGAKYTSDYQSTRGTLFFGAGDVSKTIAVSIKNDMTLEKKELFYVDLLNPSSGTTVVDSRGIVTILDDDSAPTRTAKRGKVSRSLGAMDQRDPLLNPSKTETFSMAQSNFEPLLSLAENYSEIRGVDQSSTLAGLSTSQWNLDQPLASSDIINSFHALDGRFSHGFS